MGNKNIDGEKRPWGFYGWIVFTLAGLFLAIAFVPKFLVKQAVNTSQQTATHNQMARESTTTTKTVTQLSDTQTQEEVVIETTRDLSPDAILSPKERIDLENSTRTNISQIIGGAFVIVGVFLTGRNIKAAEKSVSLTAKSQVTERFSKAIGYLESENPVTRLGGIYTLEGIARESPDEWHWQIMQILTTYIRRESPWEENESEDRKPVSSAPREDIQTILRVLGRRNRESETENQRLDLSGTDLRGYKLMSNYAHFERADFSKSYLGNANLSEGHFQEAVFNRACLTDANLVLANMQKAKFINANLENADISETDLSQANLTNANIKEALMTGTILENTLIEGASFEGAITEGLKIAGTNLSKAVKLWPKEGKNTDLPSE